MFCPDPFPPTVCLSYAAPEVTDAFLLATGSARTAHLINSLRRQGIPTFFSSALPCNWGDSWTLPPEVGCHFSPWCCSWSRCSASGLPTTLLHPFRGSNRLREWWRQAI